ncbi:MAG TPA: thioredoxin-like domain-containing protein [Pyrinomonadaceae bacterium]
MKRLFAVFMLAALALVCARAVVAQAEDDMPAEYRGRVRAPELTGGRGWLNTDKPLTIAGLRGKVVLLDFWTYGCINCIHIIPDLKRLEAKYPNELVVIGVHSAKFTNERETDNIRRVVLRYELEHPVVNDAEFAIWQAYAVRAWPTRYLIDPAGYVVGRLEGEGRYDVLDKLIGDTIKDFRARGQLNEQPIKLALERAQTAPMPLAFPGKVLADAVRDRLFVADSNHNRIVVTRLDGTLVDTIGTGARGAADGAFDRATFYRPQGLALDGDALYVADTENHLLRRVDLAARTVTTVAGTGAQARTRPDGGPGRSTALSSPWDLQLVGRTLYVAMAGTHQIWQYELDGGRVSVFAGTGAEARVDGPRAAAAFAQPSGLATDGATLYVADSESNIIRALRLGADQPGASAEGARVAAGSARTSQSDGASASSEEVRTLAGGDLFEFGDADGRGDDARFQHPLGVAYADGALFVADTYNHKLRRLDPQTGAVATFAGTGQPGQADGDKPSFYEPGGLSYAAGRLYVADTNNHALRVVDAHTGATSTLKLAGLRPPEAGRVPAAAAAAAPNAEETKLAPQRLQRGAHDAALVVNVELPEGYHLNDAAPQRVQVTITSGAQRVALAGDRPARTLAGREVRLPLRVALQPRAAGSAELLVKATLFYCRTDNTGTCRIKTLTWRAPLEVVADAAPHEIKAQGRIKLEP